MAKQLFEQAIAEARTVRDAAIANAKESLEESLTPHLRQMLAAKLQEMEDSEAGEEDEMNEEEEVDENMSGFTKVTAKKKPVKEADDEEAEDDSEETGDEAGEESEEGEEGEGEEGSEEGEDEDDIDIGKLSVADFKELLHGIIAQELESGEGEGGKGDDMDGGDIEGMGEEPGMDKEPGEEGGDEEEIDLDEILRELGGDLEEEAEGESEDESELYEARTRLTKAQKELSEAVKTINTLRKDLQEVNLLNSKLLYVNRIFKANNLTESQKVNIITAFDKAETVKEVKLVYETISEGAIRSSKRVGSIKEHRGMASKATGAGRTNPPVMEVSDSVRRMQKLAGIKK